MSLSYILFTTTDGGVRIIVLLHAYKQGFTALALAAIFSGYELAGMIVNLLAGMAGVLSNNFTKKLRTTAHATQTPYLFSVCLNQ